MTRLLLIEDDAAIARGLAENLVMEGYDVRIAPTGIKGVAASRSWSPNLVVLDLMLPDMDGFAVLRAIRATPSDVPVLILSARDQELDRLLGFRLTADDYVTKPFGLLELLARIKALLRRVAPPGSAPEPDELRFGDLRILRKQRRVYKGKRAIALGPRAFDLLLALADRPDEVVSRAALLADVWGYEPDVESRTVDWHVSELRRELGDDADRPGVIQTVRSVGYRFCPAAVSQLRHCR